jgi:chromatin segregation and condensation protein Rec8/ScpA/Scc1 (kleisin family)
MTDKVSEGETVVRELACELTDAELLERGDSMAACESAVDELKAERRRLNASIREQSDRRADLAKIIESKSETRDIACKWEPDYELKRYDLVRTDTNVSIEQKDMPEADLQMRLLPPTAITKGRATPRKRAAN